MTKAVTARLHDLATADHTMALLAERLAKLQCDRDTILHDPSTGHLSITEHLQNTLHHLHHNYIKRQPISNDPMAIRQQRLTAINTTIESCQQEIGNKRLIYQRMQSSIESECEHVLRVVEKDMQAAVNVGAQLMLTFHTV